MFAYIYSSSIQSLFYLYIQPYIHSVCPHISTAHPHIHPLIHLSIQSTIHPSTQLSIHPSLNTSVHSTIHPSIRPTIHFHSFTHSFIIYPPIETSTYLSIYASLSVCLPICMVIEKGLHSPLATYRCVTSPQTQWCKTTSVLFAHNPAN